MPFAHSNPRFTMWSKAPSIAISLPSRAAAILPHPQEQKLHEVVNSLTFASFNYCVAALTVDRSRRSPSARPAPPPTAILNQYRRLIEVKPCAFGLATS
jgi:hypothetical protein